MNMDMHDNIGTCGSYIAVYMHIHDNNCFRTCILISFSFYSPVTETRSLILCFEATLKQFTNVPEGYSTCHLCRQLVKYMCSSKESLFVSIQLNI